MRAAIFCAVAIGVGMITLRSIHPCHHHHDYSQEVEVRPYPLR